MTSATMMPSDDAKILREATEVLADCEKTLLNIPSWGRVSPPDVWPVVRATCEQMVKTIAHLSALKVDQSVIADHKSMTASQEDSIRVLQTTIATKDQELNDLRFRLTFAQGVISDLRSRTTVPTTTEPNTDSQNAGTQALLAQQTPAILTVVAMHPQVSNLRVRPRSPETEAQIETECSRRRSRENPAILAVLSARSTSKNAAPDKTHWARDLQDMGAFTGLWTDAQKSLHLEHFEAICKKATDKLTIIENIDRHAFGQLDTTPPWPRTCLYGNIFRHKKGPGGEAHTHQNRPNCKGQPEHLCCWASFNPNVKMPFGIRGETGAVPPGPARTYARNSNRVEELVATNPEGQVARWYWHLRKAS